MQRSCQPYRGGYCNATRTSLQVCLTYVDSMKGLYYVDFAHLDLAALALASSPTAAEIFPALGWSNSRLYALHLSGSLLLFA